MNKSDLIQAVERALNVENATTNEKGFVTTQHACIARAHEHDDKRPAAAWNKDTHVLFCQKCQTTYGLEETARQLGIDTNGYKPYAGGASRSRPVDLSKAPEPLEDAHGITLDSAASEVRKSKQEHGTLEKYAEQKGIPVWMFEKFGWTESTYTDKDGNNRPCVLIKHPDDIDRIRFLDAKGGFQPAKKHNDKKCLYALGQATKLAKLNNRPLVLCNGQPSTVVGHYYGLPAFCQTDGESVHGLQPQPLRDVVKAVRDNNLSLIIALDADEPGRKMAARVAEQMLKQGIVAQVLDFGGNAGYDLADLCKQYTTNVYHHLKRLTSYGVVDKPIVSSAGMAKDVRAEIEGISERYGGDVARNPVKSLRELGGFAETFEPGMLTAIIAPTKGGKTSFVEWLIEPLLECGNDIFVFNREWDSRKLMWRRLQRKQVVSFAKMRFNKQYHDEIANNTPREHCWGIKLTEEERKDVHEFADEFEAWPGKLWVFQNVKFTEDILNRMLAQLLILRRENKRMPIAVFDYMQLLRTREEERARTAYETMIDKIKDWSMDNGVHSIIPIQIGKDKAERKTVLTEYDAHWVRPDAFNLILTLNIMTEADPDDPEQKQWRKVVLPTNESNRVHHAAIVNACKNNSGRPGKIHMLTDFELFSWWDRSWGKKEFSTKDES